MINQCAAMVLGLSLMTNVFASGNIESGRALVLNKYGCVACHGENMNKPIDPSYPKLAGQHADYIAYALRAYQAGEHPLSGRTNAIMAGQAKPLSQQEIDDIAAYIASLRGNLVTHP